MAKASAKKTMIGGQAVIEGIMMRGPFRAATVVRAPQGIVSKTEELTMIKDKHPVLGWPVIRGVVNFVDSMRLGMKSLSWSAEYYPEEADEPEKTPDAAGQTVSAGVMPEGSVTPEETDEPEKSAESEETVTPEESAEAKGESGTKEAEDKKEGAIPKALIGISMFLGILLAIGLFMLLPAFLTSLLDPWVHKGVWRNLIEGGIRLVILLGYMIGVSRLKDIQRVFSYHGAEHKTIACYEAGEELTVENVKKYPPFHPRCGTSFLFTVVIISILVFSIAVPFESVWIRLASRVLLLPLVVALSYEINRLVGKYDNGLTWFLRRPGIWMQRLTTHEPDASMMEVGILALKMVLPEKTGADDWGVNN